MLLQKRLRKNTILPINGQMLVAPILERMKPTEEAAKRRLKEELGIDTEISEKFYFIYKADVGGNLWEHELDHVFVGNYEGDFQLNLEEVAEVRYISMENFRPRNETKP